MHGLQLTFKILTAVGCWRPHSWSSWRLRIIYNAYTFFIFIFLYSFLISQILDILLNVQNTDDFTENFYATLASIISCSKMLSLLVNRSNIDMLVNLLIEKPYKSLNIDEIKIQYKFDKVIHTKTLYYTILLETTCMCISVTSLFTIFRERNLTYRAWLPYDYYSSTVVFCLTYAHQLIGLTAGSLVNVGCDSLIGGLLLQICCQFEILKCRLNKVSNSLDAVGDFVHHHDSIFDYATKFNDKFRMTIAIQFAVSMAVMCSNLYQMAKTSLLSVQCIPLMLYMISFIMQIFIYCWYGNEVKLKSTQLINDIFAMDWLTLDNSLRGGLLIIMNRAKMPIQFTIVYVLCMNLDSFVGLLKTSYSIYNILKQVQEP